MSDETPVVMTDEYLDKMSKIVTECSDEVFLIVAGDLRKIGFDIAVMTTSAMRKAFLEEIARFRKMDIGHRDSAIHSNLSAIKGASLSARLAEKYPLFVERYLNKTPLQHLKEMTESEKSLRDIALRSKIFLLDDDCVKSFNRFSAKILARPPRVFSSFLRGPLALPFQSCLIMRPRAPIAETDVILLALGIERISSTRWRMMRIQLRPQSHSADPADLSAYYAMGAEIRFSHVMWTGSQFMITGYDAPDGDASWKDVEGLDLEDSLLTMTYWLFNEMIPNLNGEQCFEVPLCVQFIGSVKDKHKQSTKYFNTSGILVLKKKNALIPANGKPVEFPKEYTCRWRSRGHYRKIDGIGKNPAGEYVEVGRTWVIDCIKGPDDKAIREKKIFVKGEPELVAS